MLHEVLLAVLGFTGDLIVDEREQRKTLGLAFHSDSPLSDECTFKLAPDISFIEPSERDLIERLIKLGFYYRELDRFAKKSRNLSWIRSGTSVHPLERADEWSKQSREKKPSVYRRAIANGIGEILSVYRSAVLHIEQKLLAETTPILATVAQGLNKDMLPDYIPMRLGESILFAGKAIRVLRNPSPAFQFQKDKSFQQTMCGCVLKGAPRLKVPSSSPHTSRLKTVSKAPLGAPRLTRLRA